MSRKLSLPVIVATVARQGELDKFEDTALQIIDSITYTAPAG